VSQPRQGNRHLLPVATAHSICDDIYLVTRAEEINGGLCDADVALDAYDDAGEGARDGKSGER
jgi:hypothetical protein